MDILVVGGGGREHAVIKALNKSRRSGKIYALPGNGGIAEDAECFPVKATDIEGIVRFARERKVDFAVVTPDDPTIRSFWAASMRWKRRASPASAPPKTPPSSKAARSFPRNS